MRAWRWRLAATVLACAAIVLCPGSAFAHAMAPGDKGFIMCHDGIMLGPFIYLGAKHMVTGIDHLLFLLAVIFFLYRVRDVALYVTLFAVGHSVTLLAGVLGGWRVNAFAVDAIIGVSVIYKALDNLGVYQRWFGRQPDARIATLVFGLCHGLGLATKLLDFDVATKGLVPNLIAFNVGVELGQILALSAMLVAMGYWRRTPAFLSGARATNIGIAVAGAALAAYQVSGWLRAASA